MFSGSLSLAQRQRLVEGFQDDRNADESNNPDILVGTVQTLGVGLTLTRASKVVLVEPDYVRKNEEQVFARVSRIGQRNSKTVAYRMICPEVQVEAMILERQRQRGVFQDLSYGADGDGPLEDEEGVEPGPGTAGDPWEV